MIGVKMPQVYLYHPHFKN